MLKNWHSHYVNLITCGAYFGLLLAGLFLHMHALQWAPFIKLALVLAGFAFVFNLWRYQAISLAPISSIAAAAQGYVELNGIASTNPPMLSPLHGVPCVWFRAWTYAQEGEELWRLLNYVQSDNKIQLNDGAGICSINPQGAEVIYKLKKTSEYNGHRYVEEYLAANKPLYLIGNLDMRHHFNDAKATYNAVRELLAGWKANPIKLLFRFDLDRNGKIDINEWEKARIEAQQEVERRQINEAHLGDFEISQPKNGKLYLLSGMSPQVLRASYRCWVLTHLAVLVGLALVAAISHL